MRVLWSVAAAFSLLTLWSSAEVAAMTLEQPVSLQPAVEYKFVGEKQIAIPKGMEEVDHPAWLVAQPLPQRSLQPRQPKPSSAAESRPRNGRTGGFFRLSRGR